VSTAVGYVSAESVSTGPDGGFDFSFSQASAKHGFNPGHQAGDDELGERAGTTTPAAERRAARRDGSVLNGHETNEEAEGERASGRPDRVAACARDVPHPPTTSSLGRRSTGRARRPGGQDSGTAMRGAPACPPRTHCRTSHQGRDHPSLRRNVFLYVDDFDRPRGPARGAAIREAHTSSVRSRVRMSRFHCEPRPRPGKWQD
jgi:hypothetical protein